MTGTWCSPLFPDDCWRCSELYLDVGEIWLQASLSCDINFRRSRNSFNKSGQSHRHSRRFVSTVKPMLAVSCIKQLPPLSSQWICCLNIILHLVCIEHSLISPLLVRDRGDFRFTLCPSVRPSANARHFFFMINQKMVAMATETVKI